MKKILIVDNQTPLHLPGTLSLQTKGYHLEYFQDLPFLQEKLQELTIGGVLLSFEFGGHSIAALIREIKLTLVDVPLVVYLKENNEFNSVFLLEAGADEVISIERNQREAQARVLKIFNLYQSLSLERFNHESTSGNCIEIGDVKLYPQSFKLFKEGKEILLTPREITLLIYLYKNRNRTVAWEEIIRVWRKTFGSTSENKRNMDVTVYKLRSKIGLDDSSSFNIVSIYRKGYAFQINEAY